MRKEEKKKYKMEKKRKYIYIYGTLGGSGSYRGANGAKPGEDRAGSENNVTTN